MNKKFPIKIDDVFCEAQDLPKSSLVVELKYARDLEENYKYLIHDTCDTDTYVRERVKAILTEKEIDGDSYGVPSIEDIVDSLCKIIENKEMKEKPNPDYKNAPVNILYGHGKDFIEVRDGIEGNLAEGFVKGVFEIIELKKEIKKLQKMFAMQVKLVTALEIEKIELRNIIEVLTKGKLPCNPDHNGECLVCDNWLSDCPLTKK